MHTNFFSFRSLVVVPLFVVSSLGCNASDDSQPATDEDYDDVAQAMGAVVATDNQGGEVGSISDATSIAIGAPRLGLAINLSGGISGQRGALTYAYTAECTNLNGDALDVCDGTADTAHIAVSWSGELATPHMDASIDHQGDLEFTGLQGDPVGVNGAGSFDYDASFRSLFRDVERSYHLSYDATYSNLSVSRFPTDIIGGSAHYVIDAERMVSADSRQSDATFHMDATITFNDDGSAMLMLDETHHYTIDTRTGVVEK